MKMKKIGVLMGGMSKEREISLRTGAAIAAALKRQGYQIESIDADVHLIDRLKEKKIEVAFIALHGKLGEDGSVQGMLEWLRIPYTGSGVMASSIAMEKIMCKRIAHDVGLPVASHEIFRSGEESPMAFAKRYTGVYPAIVKPSREGSTVNTTIVENADALAQAIETALGSDDLILIEKFIRGEEVTVGILNGKSLPPLEIAPKSGFYDYTSKYTKGMTEYLLPARISGDMSERLMRQTAAIYQELGCKGVARADFMIGEEGECFLEINTIPGMTETSLVPKAAQYVGIDFDMLCEEILKTASLKVRV
ncbi:MAG: D-alanine--D-alanine ligase [Deltaproteobacteria bacterium]|nr:D-alanine--D-alanine ligase [Deltaproteobacteria bacterium]